MGIDRESDIAANLQIGPTSLGMVRLYIETETHRAAARLRAGQGRGVADELRAAAEKARAGGAAGQAALTPDDTRGPRSG